MFCIEYPGKFETITFVKIKIGNTQFNVFIFKIYDKDNTKAHVN